MRDVFGNAIGVVGVVAGPMLVVYCWFPRKLKFARRFSVMLTGASMIALLAWMYLHRA
jgi:hypothetical protein